MGEKERFFFLKVRKGGEHSFSPLLTAERKKNSRLKGRGPEPGRGGRKRNTSFSFGGGKGGGGNLSP